MLTPAQASARIWALVSGFPGDRAARRQLLMLQCYVDGSGTGDPNLFVMAGYLAPAERWAEFSKEWQERLDMAPRLECFKMSEMAQSATRMERAGWFYRVIEQHVTGAVSCSVPVPTLLKCLQETKFPEGFDTYFLQNPYYYGFHAMVNGLAHSHVEMGLREPIDFIFDEESVKQLPPEAWDMMKIAAGPEVRKFIGRSAGF